ncbi:MAG TPA: SusC/RagA family TonB-linked outer membrane protein [Agriterribacter sp.]|nr:SusC/RagA family TonB-linked outer membrane protein [Agriterribacter sp.]
MRKSLALLAMLVLCSALAWSQTKTVTGKVTDENGGPVPFATVKIKGSSSGVAADQNGNFSISADPKQKLVISAAGFDSQEISVGNQSVIGVSLKAAAVLQEVVVTALGIKKSEKALGYSVSKVDPNTLLQKSEPDVLKSLQGKVPGVDIRSSQGTPGAATRIQIRGNTSFFGDNQPLIIVDGIPYSNDQITSVNQVSSGGAYSTGLSDLDPNDIASMNVLKGSSAAALYGSRASNGAIIITTKSGSAARSRKGLEVSYSSSYSVENIANLPEYQNSYGTGSQLNAGGSSNGSWGAKFGTIDSVGTWSPYRELLGPKVAYRAYPDNVKSLFKTGNVIENSISVNGGDDKTSVALTASQLNHNGYVPYSSFKRTNIGLGGSTRLDFGLNIRANFSYSNSNQQGGFFGENQVDFSSQFARSLFLGRSWDLDLPFEDEEGNNLTFLDGQFDNPKWSAKYNKVISNDERYVAGLHADFNINPWIKVDYNIGTNVATVNRREITEISSTAASAEGLGRLILDNNKKEEIESNLLLTLTPKINDDFHLRVVLGNNINQRTITRQANTGKKFITRGIYTLSNTAQQSFGVDLNYDGNYYYGDTYSRRRLVGAFGSVNLDYRNYAYIEFTGRNDWSSTLPVESRSYFYPSVSGSFVFSDAFDLKNDFFDFGKIRASWSKVGRDADPYSLEDVFVLGTNFLSQPTASKSSTTYDPNLKPEFTQEIELGTQLSFLKRRIDLDFTVYQKISTNLIAPITVPVTSGYSQYYTNYGKISNKGIEIGLTVKPVVTNNFVWSIGAAFTKNENIVKELIEGTERLQLRGVLGGSSNINPYLEPGMPFGYLRGDVSARDSATGQLLIDPTSGNMIQSLTPGFLGNPNPDFKLGITNTFNYKGFFLSVLFDMTKGGDIYSSTVYSLLGRGVTKDTEDRETGWVIPGIYGDEETGLPILVGGKTVQNQTRITTNDLYFTTGGGGSFGINTASEWNVYDATVYRIRELALGYDFPRSVLGNLPIGSASITVTGRNLWYSAPNFPKYTHFDPEVNSLGAGATQGIELSAAPTTRRFGINLRVTF